MFTYIRLKNYKSLVDFNVDFTGKRGKAKNFILIYGENGVGKSNLATCFYTLCESLRTRSIVKYIDLFHEKLEEKEIKDESFIKFINDNFRSTEDIINSCKTIGSDDNMILEYGFSLKGKKGIYYLETDDKSIVAERLEFVWNKNQTVFYDINSSEVKMNKSIFKVSEYENDLRVLIEKYWGKHSLLSLLQYEIEDKKEGYVNERINKSLLEVLNYFMNLFLRIKSGNRIERGKIGSSYLKFEDLDSGKIPNKSNALKKLQKTECFLNTLFTSLYSDVKKVYYRQEVVGENIKYQLFFKKLIFSNLLDISFDKESSGTQNLLNMIPYLLAGVEGHTAVLDEIDTGIHDLLIANILQNLNESLKGQIIMTTHNTALLESDLDKDSIYFFNVDQNANKSLLPLSEYEDRIHPNLNIRKRYLKGLYGGVPSTMDVDFIELLDIMK